MPVASEADVERAIVVVQEAAEEMGFSRTSAYMLGTVAAELARNMLYHAGRGRLTIHALDSPRVGIEIRAEDKGSGIADLEKALQDGYSTRGGLGIGLPAVKRLMDDVDICSTAAHGTTIVARKWLR